MISNGSFTVQLHLASTPLTPFDVHAASPDAPTVSASFAAPLESLSVGTEWYLVWRDDRSVVSTGEDERTTVGLVYESEGPARDVAPSMVGSAVSSSRDRFPCVKGIVRMGFAPLRLSLVLRTGSPQPLPMGSEPLATFDLVVYCETGSAQLVGGPVNAGSPPRQLSSGVPLPDASSEQPQVALPPSYAHFDKPHHTDEACAFERDRAQYFENAVSTLYKRLPPEQTIAYLSHRLLTESLAPSVRMSVAAARQHAVAEYEKEIQEALKAEIDAVVAAMKAKDEEARKAPPQGDDAPHRMDQGG
ncbi:hypothetical protein JCM10212_003588 [Sporobolomyces blumeae]